jgi:hypothetical protein
LFKDEQRRILNEILTSTHEDLEQRFRLITERYTPLMKFLQNVGAPLPPALETAREYVLREDIRHQLEADPLDFAKLRNLIEEARSRNGQVLDSRISFVVKNRMERLINELAANPAEVERMNVLDQLAQLVMPLPLGLNLWKVQNLYWSLLQNTAVEAQGGPAAGEGAEKLWMDRFLKLGATLGFAHKTVGPPKSASKMAA